jgi:3-oxoacyl-(acyl-carrier-protein) synthase
MELLTGTALEVIFTCAMLRGGWIAPSIHAEPLDAALADYPPVTVPTARELRHALSNSLGFGGTTSASSSAGPSGRT